VSLQAVTDAVSDRLGAMFTGTLLTSGKENIVL